MAKKLKVKNWCVKGEFGGTEKDSDDILDSAVYLLDKSCTSEILGRNVFQAENGRFYQVQVQAQIIPLTKAEASEIMSEEQP